MGGKNSTVVVMDRLLLALLLLRLDCNEEWLLLVLRFSGVMARRPWSDRALPVPLLLFMDEEESERRVVCCGFR
jgi:hypothetical protein